MFIYFDGFEVFVYVVVDEFLVCCFLLESLIFDLGCGVGFFSVILVKKGYVVWGVDIFKVFIDKVKVCVLLGIFVYGFVYYLDLLNVVVVCVIGEIFNYVVMGYEGVVFLIVIF